MGSIVPQRTSICLAACLLAACSALREDNHIAVIDVEPIDSADVSLFDTITATIDYEFESQYKNEGAVLALEQLCSENVVGEVLVLDTLYPTSAVMDVKFQLVQFSTMCDYENRPRLHVVRFKLIYDRSGSYAQVTVSQRLHFFLTS